MKIIEKLQTLEKEDARKVVFEELGKRAIDVLNEVSKATLGSYIKKATSDVKGKAFDAGYTEGSETAKAKKYGEGMGAGKKQDDEAIKRTKNISKAVDKLTKEETILEYHATGTVGNEKFKIVTNDAYDAKQVAKQNPHLSPKHVKAVVAHTESDEFQDDNDVTTIQNGLTVNSNSGGYYGDVDDTKAKYTKE